MAKAGLMLFALWLRLLNILRFGFLLHLCFGLRLIFLNLLPAHGSLLHNLLLLVHRGPFSLLELYHLLWTLPLFITFRLTMMLRFRKSLISQPQRLPKGLIRVCFLVFVAVVFVIDEGLIFEVGTSLVRDLLC
jgi:uncharacterized membrane protein YesL